MPELKQGSREKGGEAYKAYINKCVSCIEKYAYLIPYFSAVDIVSEIYEEEAKCFPAKKNTSRDTTAETRTAVVTTDVPKTKTTSVVTVPTTEKSGMEKVVKASATSSAVQTSTPSNIPDGDASKKIVVSCTPSVEKQEKKQQIAIADQTQLKQMASQLGISELLDFENVDIQTFLDNNPGYAKSGQKVKADEYGVVQIKNLPEPILLTNTAYYTAQGCFGETKLYHVHPLITAIPFSKYKAVNSKVFKTCALKCDYRETENGLSAHIEGEIPSHLDKDTLDRVLQFLNYAAYGTQPAILALPDQTSQATPQKKKPFSDIADKGLRHLEKKYSELNGTEIKELLLGFVLKHETVGYHTVGMEAFDSKITKAIAAYARVQSDEKLLVMEDDTIFGSAKEGFVLTDKHIYINISGCKNKCVAIADITDVFTTREMGLTDVVVATARGNYRLTYRSNDAESQACKSFLLELIRYIQQDAPAATVPPAESVPAANSPVQVTAATTTQSVSKWQCACGNINTGKFCPKCGTKQENGTPLWTCTCGSVNKGKFCPNCGSPKV